MIQIILKLLLENKQEWLRTDREPGLKGCLNSFRDFCSIFVSWYRRLNPENRINRKPDDQKNDKVTDKAKNPKTESTVLNPILGPIYI